MKVPSRLGLRVNSKYSFFSKRIFFTFSIFEIFKKYMRIKMFYIRRNNNKFNSIETEHIVIAHLLH